MTGSIISQSVNIKLVYTSLVGFIMGYIYKEVENTMPVF